MVKVVIDMYVNNIYNFVDEFFDEESKMFVLNLEDDIFVGCVIVYEGKIINEMLLNVYKGV